MEGSVKMKDSFASRMRKAMEIRDMNQNRKHYIKLLKP